MNENPNKVLTNCRICQQNSDKVIKMSNKIETGLTLLELFKRTTHLVANANDSLPQVLCRICIEQLKEYSEFLEMAQESDVHFRNMLLLQTTTTTRNQIELQTRKAFSIYDGSYPAAFHEGCEDEEIFSSYFDDNDEQEDVYYDESIDNMEMLIRDHEQKETEQQDTSSNDSIINQSNDIPEENLLMEHTQEIDLAAAKVLTANLDMTDHFEEIYVEDTETIEIHRLQKTIGKSSKICCKDCNELFTNENELNEHSSAKHQKKVTCNGSKTNKKKNFKCDICGKAYPSRQKLDTHYTVHTGVKPYKCPICEKLFSSIYRQREHTKTHNNERNFICELCDKRFFTSSHLKKHSLTHTNCRPYICEHCGKSFTQSSALKTHKTLHEGKPVKCDICDRKYSCSSTLKVHQRQHTNDRPYKCGQCTKTYMQKVHLDRHKMCRHLGVRFECTHCRKSYTSKSTLDMHIAEEHLINKIYRCEICSWDFRKQKGYYYHMQKKHAEAK